jgi:ribosome recycling factor
MTYKILPDTETQIKFVSYTLDGVEYKIAPINDNGVLRHLTETEAEERANLNKDWDSKSNERKLIEIKNIRLQKLKETDWMANSDVTMPDNIKTYRQKLRDIPQDYTTEDEYDLLLARDEQGNLTHTVWSKP